MSAPSHDVWSEQIESALAGYSADLVRNVAARLLKTRSQWPVDELVQRICGASVNAPLIDRRLKDLPGSSRKMLALMGLSRRPTWSVAHLLDMLTTLGNADGIMPISTLFEEGLVFPVRSAGSLKLRNIASWLYEDAPSGLVLFAHPFVTGRARSESLALPEFPARVPARPEIHEADGLEFPLRLAVVWQQVSAAPLRQTQQQDFFKRDLQRLGSDAMLNAPFADNATGLLDIGLLAVEWALRAGLLRLEDAEMHAEEIPDALSNGLYATLDRLWQALPDLRNWDPLHGWRPGFDTAPAFSSLYPLVLATLAKQPPEAWVGIGDIEQWAVEHHPHWHDTVGSERKGWATPMVAGLLFQLRIVQCAAGSDGDLLVRLSPFGRWLASADRAPPTTPEYPQTLICQANFEILLFRQGLTPQLLATLSRFVRWKSIGTACLMELNSEQVYHGLESGLSFEAMWALLQRHSMRPIPENVRDALQTWSNKRERVVVYENATLIEFATTVDLDSAVARGLVELRLTDRIGLVRDDNAIDYRHLRLTGTRDYGARIEPCIVVAEDGVTLRVDAARADLLLDWELARAADPARNNGDAMTRIYQFTRASLRRAIDSGLSVNELDEWLILRAGEPLSPAARLLAIQEGAADFRLERCLVLHAPSEALANGLLQWQGTRALVRQRLGPTALLIAEDDVPRLQQQLAILQQPLLHEGPA